MSVSYISNKGINLTYLSEQYFVPHWPKSGVQKMLLVPLAKLSPHFQNRGAAHGADQKKMAVLRSVPGLRGDVDDRQNFPCPRRIIMPNSFDVRSNDERMGSIIFDHKL